MDFIINSTEKEIFLEYIDNKSNRTKLISISENSNKIKVENPQILKSKNIIQKIKTKAILGKIGINNSNFILYVKSSTEVGKIKNEIIYLITEVDFFEIPSENNNTDNKKEIKQFKEGISKILKTGLYYSFGLDLTNSRQNQAKKLYSLFHDFKNNDFEYKIRRIFLTCNKKYFFNYNLYKDFIDDLTSEPIDYTFIVPIICGYIGIYNFIISNKHIKFVLISRRSQNYAGTRYNTRGINDDGNVANFCESEHIVIYGNIMCSFCQLRGSAPVFFEQLGLRAHTGITRNKDLTIQAFSKHLQEIGEDYPLIYFINLLNEKKSIEAPIIAEFETQVKFRENNDNFRYFFFDMQNECKNDNYSRIDDLMNDLKQVVELFNFFSQNINTNQIYSIQKGTTRTNCLDCLDRTNVIETRISWLVLEMMLKFFDFDQNIIDDIFNKESFFKQSTKNDLKDIFKDLWSQNGDQISIQYAGTASTITTVTKTGGHNFKGMIDHGIATVTRFYQGTFEDEFKQECIDILLQKDISGLGDEDRYSISITKEYTKIKDFYIFIGNYNLSGKSLTNSQDVESWLTSYKSKFLNSAPNLKDNFPDFYILGFEEISKSTKDKNSTKDLIKNTLLKLYKTENKDSFQLMNELDYNDLYILLFIKASCLRYVKNFDSQVSKYSLLFRFNINESKIAIACSQLHNIKSIDKRKHKMMKVLNSSFKKYPGMNFKDYDFFFYFGDLNIRLDKNMSEQLVDKLKQINLKQTYVNYSLYLEYDEFYKEKDSFYSDMAEAHINFSPTYKYKKGTLEYEQKKTPFWSDRIFFKKGLDSNKFTPLAYNKCLMNLSEHQPIYGVYKLNTKIIDDQQKKLVIEQKIKENKMK